MIVCALMVARDEAPLLAFNIQYHLDLGFDYILVLDHCSQDDSLSILDSFNATGRVLVVSGDVSDFDHEKLANDLLTIALERYAPDWVFFLDADEFLGTRRPFREFLREMQDSGVKYGTIKWLNALLDIDAAHPLHTQTFFEPWAERDWQHDGHFRKAFCRRHAGMSVVVGGHYFRVEANPHFFKEQTACPVLIDIEQARIYHFENRFGPKELMRKWENLASNLVEPNYSPAAPWNEKLSRLREYVAQYRDCPERLADEWFRSRRTFWGSRVPEDRVRIDSTLRRWAEAQNTKA